MADHSADDAPVPAGPEPSPSPADAGSSANPDVFSPADLDAALSGLESAAAEIASFAGAEVSTGATPAASADTDESAAPSEVDAVLAMADAATASAAGDAEPPRDSTGRPLDQAAEKSATPGLAVQPLELPDFSRPTGAGPVHDISILRDVKLNVHIELGRTRMYIEDVLRLSEGSVVELNNLAGDPVDVYVNGRLVARGEVLVLSDNFCVRVSEIVTGLQHAAVA